MQPSNRQRTYMFLRNRRPIALGVLAVASILAYFTSTAAPSFTPDAQPTGWIMRPALSSNNLKSNAEVIYRPGYSAGDWYGTLTAHDIDRAADIAGSSPWSNDDAADLLDQQNFDTGRNIVTLKSDGTKIPFRWSSLSGTQQASLGDSTTGPKILDFATTKLRVALFSEHVNISSATSFILR
jgi:Tfp pilus tip-associated adhesin PilY1